MTEESFSLRHNPLGIHSLDGTDIVIGKAPRHVPITTSTSEDSISTMSMRAKKAYYDQGANVSYAESDDSVPTGQIEDQLANLGISDGTPLKDVVSLDFGSDFGNDMTGLLSRKRTITSRTLPKSVSQPVNLTYSRSTTKTPFLAQRLKSIRKRISSHELREIDLKDEDDDFKRAEALPEDVLKMIAFSPDSPWLDTNNLPDSPLTPEIDKFGVSQSNAALEPPASKQPTAADLNPFNAAAIAARKEAAQNEVGHSPSVSTLASVVSDLDSGEKITQVQAKPRRPLTIDQLDPVTEDDRGRLFLQINKIANLKGLPIDSSRNPKFMLSLDNGLQTVTTEPSALPSPGMNGAISAKIGQEFELTVAKDLELVLTVKVSMDTIQPPPKPRSKLINTHQPTMSTASTTASTIASTHPIESPSSTPPSPVKKTMKNFLLRSPKKKLQKQQQQQQQQQQNLRVKESKEEEERNKQHRKMLEEAREREQVHHERDMQEYYRRADIWRGITGGEGEYCRGYVFASHYEKDIYGVAKSFAIPLYNEWDTKAANNGVPKPVCDLQVTMLFIPKLYASEQIPMSMFECQKALQLARKKHISSCEGFLTQQGGDCGNIWRRRYFTLQGNELISHHEATRKRRAIIHLESVASVNDTLSDDLWSIYEDRSFQINFDDGESIGFYADTIEARDTWIRSLRDTVANCTGQHRSWTDLVLESESKPKH